MKTKESIIQVMEKDKERVKKNSTIDKYQKQPAIRHYENAIEYYKNDVSTLV